MNTNLACAVRPGIKISYDDGRPGHRGVKATVISVQQGHGMLVQFDDRADSNYIRFSEREWLNSITLLPEEQI